MTPRVFLLFGGNCAGKSTLARALAARLPRAAHIEVDAMRYLIVGGLVAVSAGVSPHLAPEEYRRQCLLGDENAALLARSFAAHGFASVIEGLEDEHGPGSAWVRTALAGLRPCSVLVTCSDAVRERRWRERCGSDLPAAARQHAAAMMGQRERFELVADSSETTPESLAERIADARPS